MKKSYNLVKSCLFFILIISFSIITISAELNLYITPNTTIYKKFTYTENTFSQSQPYAIDIQVYDDGTTLIHLVRNNNTENCFEPILRIRIIHLNGSVTEINTDLNLDSVNYCLFKDILTGEMVNPISIRPLKQTFILGTVLNWNGEKLSSIPLEPSSVYFSEKIFWPMKSLIEININKELFLYVNSYGNSIDAIVLTESDLPTTNYTLFTSLATVDEGYAILYAKYLGNKSDFMSSLGGLYASFIAYNQISMNNSILLFPITSPEMKINAVHCNAFLGFCYYCIASIIYNNTVQYEEIQFCTGKFLNSNPIQTPNEIGVPWNVFSTPTGGYILSAVNATTCFIHISEYSNPGANLINLTYFNTTGVSAYGFLKLNNTLLLSLRDTNRNHISWSLLTVHLPTVPDISGYYNYGNIMITNVTPSINFNVDSSTTNISISFAISVDLSTGNITIYKFSDNSIRQSVSVTSEFCKLSNDSKVVNISIIDSTFNEYGEKYYVKVDNNFANASTYFNNEPLRGIESYVWILKSSKFDQVAATGLVVLTIDASKKFLTSSRNNQSEYFDTLLDEFALKVPVRRERLSSDKKFQYFDEFGQIAISIRIDLPTNETENTVPGVFSNLNNMILYKGITTFYTGVTNDLNSTLGFQPQEGPWDKFKLQIIAAIATFVIICLFYHILSYKLHSKKFEALSSAILRLGLIIPNFILSIHFIVYNSNDIQELHLPSVSILANLTIAIYTFYNGINELVVGKEFKEWVKHKQELVAIFTIFTILATTDYEYLIILKDAPIFNKITIDYKYLTIIKDVTKAEIDDYLKILEDVPISDESDKIKQIDMLKTLKYVLTRFEESVEFEIKKVKWVPIDGNNLQEIDDKLDFFMASLKIRTIKNESGRYTRSRTKSQVDLIKLHDSQINTLDFIKKLNEMTKEKYKIYGITRDGTEQYMIVLDYYFNKRDINKYGECKECKRPNTNPEWCQSCDPSVIQNKSL
ncbi:20958_t:CDS:10, partial [Cetraspora pellucida]